MDTDKQKLFKRAAMLIEIQLEMSAQMLTECSYIRRAKEKLRRLLLEIAYHGWEEDFDEYVMTFQHLM